MTATRLVTLLTGLALSAPAFADGRPALLWSLHDPAEIAASRPPGDPPQRVAGQWEAAATVVDVAAGRIYWSDEIFFLGTARLMAADLDGQNVEVLREGLGFVTDIELHDGTLYWADQLLDTISRMNVDGSGYQELLTGLGDPTWLALDPDAATMYYVTLAPLQLHRAGFDGSAPVTLVASLPQFTFDVEVDTDNDKLYFGASANFLGIYRRDLDGMNPTSLLLENAVGIELRGGALYYGSFDGALVKVGLDGSSPTPVTPANEMTGETFDLDLGSGVVYQSDRVSNRHLARFDIDLVDTSRTILVERFEGEPHDVALDPGTGDVFFTSSSERAILRVDLDGSEHDTILDGQTTLEDTRGLAYDPAAQRLYWTRFLDATSGGGIYAALTDGSPPVVVVPALEWPHDLALDLANGHLYWTENAGFGTATVASIRRADLDGSNVVDILLNESAAIRGIDVDPTGGKLYWTDHGCDCIHRADLDGMNRETILDGGDGVIQPHDVAVDPVGGVLYWTEGISNSGGSAARIRRANLDGSSPTNLHTGLREQIRDLTFARVTYVFADGFESGNVSRWSATSF